MLEKRLHSFASEPLAIVAAAAVVFSALSIYELRDFQWGPRDLHTACSAIVKLAPDTGITTIKVWAFWAWSALLIAGFVRKLDPNIEWFDGGLIGMAGVWVLAYFSGILLGPMGLFRAPTLWLATLAATLYLWPNISRVVFRRPSFGVGLALVALALASVSLLPLALGSPVVPYMDVLSSPASAQRVITFGTYLPFNNEPYGIFGPNVQLPALELFNAYLALGSYTHLAALAESTMVFPIAMLTILAAYRLGATLFDDVSGGAAALLLFLTVIFRRLEGMRGTDVDFALVALGLALFLDARRSPTVMACGALMLGVTVPSHVIDGALAIGVASAACGAWLLAADLPRFRAGALSMAGALLVGAPEIAIARAIVVPVPVLMLSVIAGAALIIYGASRLRPRTGGAEPRVAVLLARLLLGIVTATIFHDFVTRSGSVYGEVPSNYLVLGILAIAGLAVTIVRPPPTDTVGRLCAIAAMLLPALAILRILTNLPAPTSVAADFERFDVSRKIADCWMPFAMVFPAARLIAVGCELLPEAAVMTMLLAVLFYSPRRIVGIDYYDHEHSIGENWMIDFSILTSGYWTNSADPRWTANPAQFQLFEVLRNEIRAGRITTSTNILHLVHDVDPYRKWVRFSVFTGVNDDPLVITPSESQWNMFMTGGRARSITHFKEALAKRPMYILSEIPLSEPLGIPDDYERIFDSGGITLYRRNDRARN
jgi:hypothetical protein